MNASVVEQASLYERLGGAPAIDAAVETFYGKLMADPQLKPFFDGVDMGRQRAKQKVFLAFAFGAPVRYTGKDLTAAHQALVARGLDDSHFDAVAGHLQATLAELGVPAELIGEVMAIAGSTRDAVLGRA